MSPSPPDASSAAESAVQPVANIAARVAKLRARIPWTAAELGAELTKRGVPWDRFTVASLEKGKRKNVTVDELIALASALRVSPLTLLLPWPDDPDVEVEFAGLGMVTARQLWGWALGREPLELSESDPIGDRQRYRLDALPPWARHRVHVGAGSALAPDVLRQLLANSVSRRAVTPDPEEQAYLDALIPDLREQEREAREEGEE